MGRSAEALARRARCTKIHYASQLEANMAILDFWRRRMGQCHRYPCRSYFCEEHQAWHITSMDEATYNAKRPR